MLLDRDGLGEVARLVDVGAHENGRVIGEQLDWDGIDHWGDYLGDLGQHDGGHGLELRGSSALLIGDEDDLAAAGGHFLHV